MRHTSQRISLCTVLESYQVFRGRLSFPGGNAVPNQRPPLFSESQVNLPCLSSVISILIPMPSLGFTPNMTRQ